MLDCTQLVREVLEEALEPTEYNPAWYDKSITATIGKNGNIAVQCLTNLGKIK